MVYVAVGRKFVRTETEEQFGVHMRISVVYYVRKFSLRHYLSEGVRSRHRSKLIVEEGLGLLGRLEALLCFALVSSVCIRGRNSPTHASLNLLLSPPLLITSPGMWTQFAREMVGTPDRKSQDLPPGAPSWELTESVPSCPYCGCNFSFFNRKVRPH